MKNKIWLSFDLGVRGDYEGMYSWLDDHDAKECGSSFAVLDFDHEGDLMTSLEKEIREAISLDRRSRVYFVRMKDGKISGRYL